jgi:hypothetical protein
MCFYLFPPSPPAKIKNRSSDALFLKKSEILAVQQKYGLLSPGSYGNNMAEPFALPRSIFLFSLARPMRALYGAGPP